MRRGVQAGPEASTERELSRALTLRPSPARQRFHALEREHERLLVEIRKKKLARDASEHSAREVARALDARLGPLRDELLSALAEVQAIFSSLLGADSRLNRRDKARVRRAYAHLLAERDVADAGEPSPCREHARASGRARVAFPEEAGYSAPKPRDQGPCVLRSVFRRLAVALHPDKERDPAQRATLTAVMKEVTRAYELGDVARLVEIERSWLAAPVACEQEQDLARCTELLLQANQELRHQLRALNAELKSLRDSLALAPVRGVRGRDGTPEWQLRELERELGEVQALRDFSCAFLNGDVSLSEFLRGPALGFDEGLDRGEQLLSDAFGADFPCGRSRRRSPRG